MYNKCKIRYYVIFVNIFKFLFVSRFLILFELGMKYSLFIYLNKLFFIQVFVIFFFGRNLFCFIDVMEEYKYSNAQLRRLF